MANRDWKSLIVMAYANSVKTSNEMLDSSTLSKDALEKIIYVLSHEEIFRRQNYFEDVIPHLNDSTFKSHFRLSPSTVETILQQLANCPELHKKNRNEKGGRDQIPVEKSFLITLWTLGTSDSYRSIAHRFNVSESSVYNCLNACIKAINNNLCQLYIRWPKEDEKARKALQFANYGMQSVLGSIDGCHIPIKRPREDGDDYLNQKNFHSMVLQGICCKQLMFIDVDISWPGGVHDARVFKTSDIYQTGQERCQPTYYIIGDLAYPCLPWILSPYINTGILPTDKIHFNKVLFKTRVPIENAFALLKGRFRRIRDNLDRNDVQIIAETVVACCVLHNICLLQGENDMNEFIREGQQGINPQMDGMICGNEHFNEDIGFKRRNEVAEELWNMQM